MLSSQFIREAGNELDHNIVNHRARQLHHGSNISSNKPKGVIVDKENKRSNKTLL